MFEDFLVHRRVPKLNLPLVDGRGKGTCEEHVKGKEQVNHMFNHISTCTPLLPPPRYRAPTGKQEINNTANKIQTMTRTTIG